MMMMIMTTISIAVITIIKTTSVSVTEVGVADTRLVTESRPELETVNTGR